MRVMGGPWIGPKLAADHDQQAAALLIVVAAAAGAVVADVVVVHWNVRWQINQCRPQQYMLHCCCSTFKIIELMSGPVSGSRNCNMLLRRRHTAAIATAAVAATATATPAQAEASEMLADVILTDVTEVTVAPCPLPPATAHRKRL